MYSPIGGERLKYQIQDHVFSSVIWGRRFSMMRWLFAKAPTN